MNMNRKELYRIGLMSWLLCLIAVFPAAVAGSDEPITIVTEDLPPFNYKQDRELTGISTEVVQAVLQKVGLKSDISMYPWARAYKMALKQKNVLIYSIIRIEERENLFKWVGIVAPFEIYLYKLKERGDILITSLKDLKNYRIGGLRKDASAQFLTRHGIQVREFNTNEEMINHLCSRKTIDAISYNNVAFAYKLKMLKLDHSQFEQAYHLQEFPGELYMAFSRQTDDALVEKFRQALKSFKQDGAYDRILQKYFKAE
jgi:polar amino acid transport system substrate-binding protein